MANEIEKNRLKHEACYRLKEAIGHVWDLYQLSNVEQGRIQELSSYQVDSLRADMRILLEKELRSLSDSSPIAKTKVG